MTERDDSAKAKRDRDEANKSHEAWLRLRGALKDVYAEYGGGEAYLRKEREAFEKDMKRREKLMWNSDDLSK